MGSTSFGSSTIIHRVDSSSSVYRMYCELCDYAKYSSYYEYWFYKTLLVDYLGYAPDDECFADIELTLEDLEENGWANLGNFLNPSDRRKFTIVHLAALSGRVDILERAALLTVSTVDMNGKEIDPWLATDTFGRCALHYAASGNYTEAVSWILRKGVPEGSVHPQISLEDVFGRTPLHDAVGRLNMDVVELLLNSGAALNVPNTRGSPPFLSRPEDIFYTTDRWDNNSSRNVMYHKIVTFLSDKISNLSFCDPSGWTMLHHAICVESHKTVRYLVEHGANPNLDAAYEKVKREYGSALQYAAGIGDLESVRILVNNGGNLAQSYPNNCRRTVVSELLRSSSSDFIENFLTDLFNAQLKSDYEQNRVTLNYDILAPKTEPRQMAVISSFIKAMPQRELYAILQHPLLQRYIEKQWLRFKKLFYSFVALYTFVALSSSCYTFHLVNNNSASTWLAAFMLVLACILFCYNVLQLFAEPKQFRTWLLLLSLTLSIAVASDGLHTPNASTSWVLPVLSGVLPLSWILILQFYGQIGFLPLFDDALLLFVVLKSVLKVLFIGLFIIAGFSLSFLILFRGNDQFDTLWKTFAKTIIMMTGEYEYGDLFSATNPTNNSTGHNPGFRNEMYDNLPSVLGRIVVISFVIIATIVLMNLMIGLAVNDVQTLVNEGESDRLLQRAVFIAHCEQMIRSCISFLTKIRTAIVLNIVDLTKMMPKCCLRIIGIVTRFALGNCIAGIENKEEIDLGRDYPGISARVLRNIRKFYKENRPSRLQRNGEVNFATVQSSLQWQSRQIQQLIKSQRRFVDKNRPRYFASLKMSNDYEL